MALYDSRLKYTPTNNDIRIMATTPQSAPIIVLRALEKNSSILSHNVVLYTGSSFLKCLQDVKLEDISIGSQ